MKLRHRKMYFVGIIFMLLILGLLLQVFSLLSKTSKIEIRQADQASKKYGWDYQIMCDGKVTDVVPEFEDEYTMTLPAESIDAVKITRIMSETMSYAELDVSIYGKKGIEIFVDGEVLYSDFQKDKRDEKGYLILGKKEREKIEKQVDKKITVSLPEDYTGKKLEIITYFGEGEEDFLPAFPVFENFETRYSVEVVSSVWPVVLLTIYASFVVLIAGIFVMDIPNGNTDYRILLLGLYFLFSFLGEAYNSLPGSVSELSNYSGLWILTQIYIAPLYLYLALCLTSWRKYILSASVIGWFSYEGVQIFMKTKQGEVFLADVMKKEEFFLFLLVLLLLFVECFQKRERIKEEKKYVFYIIATLVVSIGYIISGAREWDGNIIMYFEQLIISITTSDHYSGVVHLATGICSTVAVCILVFEFIRRTIENKRMVSVLEERSNSTLEGYNRVLLAEKKVNSVRHEMLHHMIVLMGLLNNGEIKRMQEYLSNIKEEIEQLPTVKYSQNILVNIIVGAYLDRAKAEGIKVEYSLMVPADLKIADEDLSVFLNNMLENAIEACERMEPDEERYIKVKMQVNHNFLFIGCTNSKVERKIDVSHSEKEKKRRHQKHGYGIEAMNKIAEKYGSILKIDQSSSEFSVKTNLLMK